MKKCPFCAEEIQDEAIKCKHCGSWLDGREDPTSSSESQITPRQPWVIRTLGIRLRILGALICLEGVTLSILNIQAGSLEENPRVTVAYGLVALIGFVVFMVGRSRDRSLSK